MSKEIRLPALGENVEAAQVLAVLVATGDTITKDQALIEVETDKATAEVPAPFAGVVETVHVRVGDDVEVNQLVVTLATGEGDEQEVDRNPPPPAPTREPPPAPARQAPPPPAAANHTAVEPPARGPMPHLVAVPAPGGAKPAVVGSVPAAPSVRRFARELGVEIGDVAGSGPGERISLEDVKAHVRGALAARGRMRPAQPGAAMPPSASLPEREAMSGIRRKTAEKMTTAWNQIPHVTQFDRADVTELEVWRKQASNRAEAQGGKLTVTAILVRLTASALRTFPKFNASLDMDKGEVVNHQGVNIGVAVETERGLLVPVVRDADRKTVFEVAVEVTSLATRARDRKIGLEDLRGGTFSITNLGGLGTTYFSPIVNWPEVAVLGVGRAEIQAVYQDGGFQPRLHLPLSLSYDHRLIDGADAARFLRWICEALEHPLLAL